MTYFLGIDVSTTASKALLLDSTGKLVGVESSPHSISTPHPLWSEQDPEQWWIATQAAIRNVLSKTGVAGKAIASVGLTGQMHGLVMLDAGGDVLRPAILWNDQRSGAECDEIRSRLGLDRLVQVTGNDAFAGFTAPKLMWVRTNEPVTYARTEHVLLPKDFIRFKLTGDYATDKAGAGGMLLLDLASRDWSAEILDALEIPAEWLPNSHEGTELTGYISREAEAVTGLSSGCPVVGGGGDQAAGAVGMGAVTEDVWGLTIGTSGVVFAPTQEPRIERKGRVHAFPHAIPGMWHMMGVMLSAAGSLGWYHDALALQLSYDDLISETDGIEAGAEGLLFLPYLSGERTPHADSNVKGSFIGLSTRHTRAHMTRAILEGVAFGLADNFKMLQATGVQGPSQVRLSGGGAKSAVWRQIIADVLNVELVTVAATEAAASGAAILAGTGVGNWSSVSEACSRAVETGQIVSPNKGRTELYAEQHRRFRALYPALQSHFADLS